MDTAGPDVGDIGVARAERLIGEVESLYRMQGTASMFARIIVGLFPGWFDFAPGQFTVLTNGRAGFKMVVAGTTYDFAVFPTSASRCMNCYYYGHHPRTVELGQMDMHYQPLPEQVEQARAVIALALHRLFPERGPAPLPAGVEVPDGRVFPLVWSNG